MHCKNGTDHLPYIFSFLITEKIEGIRDLWIVGDTYAATTFRESYLLRSNEWYMRDHFELGIYCKGRQSCSDTNILRRLKNSLIEGLNARQKLPSIIVVLIEKDIIEALRFGNKKSAPIASALYGTWIEWLVDKFTEALNTKRKQLPDKAKAEVQPIFYWSSIPNHCNYDFETRVQIAKFNKCLDAGLKLHDNMRVVKLIQGWKYDDNLLVQNNKLTEMGEDKLWESLDSSVKFNYKKRLEYLACNNQGAAVQMPNVSGEIIKEGENTANIASATTGKENKTLFNNRIWSTRFEEQPKPKRKRRINKREMPFCRFEGPRPKFWNF